jgi:AhpD family alkylhydroperoxidase
MPEAGKRKCAEIGDCWPHYDADRALVHWEVVSPRAPVCPSCLAAHRSEARAVSLPERLLMLFRSWHAIPLAGAGATSRFILRSWTRRPVTGSAVLFIFLLRVLEVLGLSG